MPKAKTYKWPKALAARGDYLYELRTKRLAMAKLVEQMQEEETALKEFFIKNLPKGEASGTQGKKARISIYTKPIPQVEDWDKVFKFVKKTNAFELLQRRLATTAVEERWEAGKEVPGVTHYNATLVSINKV